MQYNLEPICQNVHVDAEDLLLAIETESKLSLVLLHSIDNLRRRCNTVIYMG